MNEKIEIISKWIEKGDHDLGTAKLTHLHIPKYKDTIAFHCQQSVEKYLKAYLIFIDIPVARTHNLTLLLDLISQKNHIPDSLYDEANMLQQFAIEIRYPEIVIELSDDDITTAISISQNFRNHFLNLMNVVIDIENI